MEYESLFKAARKAGTALADVEPERLGRILGLVLRHRSS